MKKLVRLILLINCWGTAAWLSAASSLNWDAHSLLPGALVFDVTDARFGAVPDDGKDDTKAIQAAIAAAAALEQSKKGRYYKQQVIYLPEGTYDISDTLACVMNNGNPAHKGRFEIPGSEGFQWIWGDGVGKTILRLRSAEEIGTFGSAEAPKPVLQTSRYSYDRKQSGNSKFQLWVTDLSIVVPDDQPHAVGLSYGVANMGAVKRVHIQAEGNGGHTGLALVQNNNGPGMIADVRVDGFNTGIEINDPSGKNFYLKRIELVNQNADGVGLAVSDKVIAIENLVVRQRYAAVTSVLLRNTKSEQSSTGGMAHLTLLNPQFHHAAGVKSAAMAIRIEQGHLYMRGADFKGYGDKPIDDHGRLRPATSGELVLVHGHTKEEKSNVVVAIDGAPARSLHLPLKSTPEIPARAWERLKAEDYTTVSQKDIKGGHLSVSTDWVIVKPSGADDTQLLQAALDSGARYIGLLNGTDFVVKDTLHVNRSGTLGNVELIYGHMSNVLLAGSITRSPPYMQLNNYVGLHLHSGRHEQLFIHGLQLLTRSPESSNWRAEDFQVIQNDAACTVTLVDIRAKAGPRAYRNGAAAEGQEVFFDNCEFAYFKAFPQELMVFKKQSIWGRNLNVEMPILDQEFKLPGLNGETHRFLSASRVPRMVNDGGQVFTIGQKLGEHGGTFMQTRGGGQTELLSAFFNQKASRYLEPDTKASILRVEGANSACSLVGVERTRNHTYPHKNGFARLRMEGAAERLLPCTLFPTMEKYAGYDPFEDNDAQRYLKKATHRVFGLFRLGKSTVSQQAGTIVEGVKK
ncbi:MAG: glycosyl hydrolase family 28-related protein [Opitutales bacterium]